MNADRPALANLGDVTYGSLRFLARKAGIDPTALKRWFSGQNTVSETRLVQLYSALGLLPEKPPRPNPEGVHIWAPKKIVGQAELELALHFFFPDRLEAAEAPWSRLGSARAKKLLRLDMTTELYAFFDNRTTMVLHRPGAGPWVDLEKIRCQRRGGSKESSTLSEQAIHLLLKDQPTPDDFLLAWYESPEAVARHLKADVTTSPRRKKPINLRDLDVELKNLGLTYEQAITALRRLKDD